MKQFINKYLNKKKTIKVVFIGNDRRIYNFYELIEGNVVKVNKNGVESTFMYDPTKVFIPLTGIDKYRPTIFVAEGNSEAINPFELEASYDAELFEVAMSNNLVKDLVRATDTKEKQIGNILLYIIIGLVAVTLFVLLKNTDTEVIPEVIETVVKGVL